jgi:hypothetical protein
MRQTESSAVMKTIAEASFGRWFLHCEHHAPTFVFISPVNEAALRAEAGFPRPTWVVRCVQIRV